MSLLSQMWHNRPVFSESQIISVKETLLDVTLTQLSTSFYLYGTQNWTVLFQNDLVTLLPYFNQSLLQLLPSDLTCSSYQQIVKEFTLNFASLSNQTKEDIFNHFIKRYLIQTTSSTDSKPKCYNSSAIDKDAWLFNNLHYCLTYATPEDLKLFVDGHMQLLEDFSVDKTTFNLIDLLDLTESLKKYFAELITAKNSSISLSSIPQKILCYAIGNLNFNSMNQSEALKIVDLIKQCGSTYNLTLPSIVMESFTTVITADVFQNLGSLAAGLSSSVILQKATGAVLVENLQTLSKIETWTVTQASTIVTKITQTNFQMTASNMESLGSLVAGMDSSFLAKLNSTEITALAQNEKFVSNLRHASAGLKQSFVQKVTTTQTNVFMVVPPSLANQISASKLLSTTTITITQINQMSWSTSQAQILFRTALSMTTDYSTLSSNILQGFTCGAAADLSDAQFQSLLKSMKGVSVSASQLKCIAKRLSTLSISSTITYYSAEVLLFMGSSSFTSNCQQYFNLVGQSNINLLPVTSPVRTSLLSSAMSCLKISSTSITEQNLRSLGALSCDLSDSAILTADKYVLTVLKSCSSFTDAQKTAINTKLISVYGYSSSWTISTLNDIGSLASVLSSKTLSQVSTVSQKRFFPGFLTTVKTQYKTSFTYVMTQLKTSKVTNRAKTVNCTNLTTDEVVTQQDLIVVDYASSDLQNCLIPEVMIESLGTLGGLAFDNDQLLVLKSKLDKLQYFPDGVPEDYLPLLGNIATVYSVKEVAKWNITQLKTLEFLLDNGSWQSNTETVNALIMQFLKQSNSSLDATVLTVIAPYVCLLNRTIIDDITAGAIGTSPATLHTSTCSQSNKNVLFDKVKSAYQSVGSSGNANYLLLAPTIGGARSADLVQIAKGSPQMDIDVFAGLNPDAVKNLNVTTLKSLLGPNVADLSTISSEAVVAAWIATHTQSEVAALGLNMTAGLPRPTPDGFIMLNAVTSGAAPHHFVPLLLSSILAAILHMAVPLF
uniref:Otoancorin n=1 Tax=Leptobrachium leishanense TaxID=445787 RepID=A0A8C5Q5H4_9ANUR